MSTRPEHVIIIGGGIAGPALGLFLRKAGRSAAVYEARPRVDDIGGGLTISPNGMNVLGELGLAEATAARGTTCTAMCFRNHRGHELARIPNGLPERYGRAPVALRRAAFHALLVEESAARGLPLHHGKRLTAVEERADGVVAHFDDGTSAEGDLLVGADGMRSRTRELALPEAPPASYSGLLGIGGFVSPSAPVTLPAGEEHTMHMSFGPAGFFGYLNLAASGASHRPEWAWWVNLPRARELPRDELAAIPDAVVLDELRDLFGRWHAPIPTFLDHTATLVRTYIHDIPSVPSWHRGRVVLVGDAAHGMSPSAGQGISVALEDAMYLAVQLRAAAGDHGAAFAAFERERRPRVEKIIANARRYNSGKQPSGAFSSWMRDRMMSVFMSLFGARSFDWLYRYRISWNA